MLFTAQYIYLHLKTKGASWILMAFSMATFLLPSMSIADSTADSLYFPTDNIYQASIMHLNKDGKTPTEPGRYTTRIIVTSYNSVPEQTDSTPFITASGTHVRDGVVASNYLPIGTRVRFPDVFGSKIFIVEDRMNARYDKKIDIWSDDLQFSKNFGVRYLKMEVL